MPIPYVTLRDPAAAIALYEKAFGASLSFSMDGPGGSIMHAEMSINGERFMLGAEWPGVSKAPEGRSPVNFMLYVPNADEAQKKAIEAGMTSSSEPEDMFWGDRMAKVNDGHGYEWTFAHQVEDVSQDEMQKRAASWLASMGGG
jgi:PhnB protein